MDLSEVKIVAVTAMNVKGTGTATRLLNIITDRRLLWSACSLEIDFGNRTETVNFSDCDFDTLTSMNANAPFRCFSPKSNPYRYHRC